MSESQAQALADLKVARYLAALPELVQHIVTDPRLRDQSPDSDLSDFLCFNMLVGHGYHPAVAAAIVRKTRSLYWLQHPEEQPYQCH